MTLRNRLIAAFLASTLVPLAATVWITTTLLDRSLAYSTTGELDRLSRTLESTAKQFYQRERDALKQDALAGRTLPLTYSTADRARWPDAIRSFWESGETERFGVSGANGERVDYMRRSEGPGDRIGVEVYGRDLGGVSMEQLSTQVRDTRRLVDAIDARDLRRGFTLTLLVLLGAAWLISLVPLILIASRTSRPIRQLTAALTDFADGDWSRRLDTGGRAGVPPHDEVGRAVDAFNRMADELNSRARTDDLTGLPNFRAFRERIDLEIARAVRYGQRFGILVLDLDRFKQYNDRFGHLAGNDALQRVSQVIRETVRAVDFPARYGGEEFAVIVPLADGGALARLAERIRARVEAMPAPPDCAQLTISIGAAIHSADGASAEALFHTADERLYEAKRLGRNRVVIGTIAVRAGQSAG